MAFVCSILTIVKKSELIREISGKKNSHGHRKHREIDQAKIRVDP